MLSTLWYKAYATDSRSVIDYYKRGEDPEAPPPPGRSPSPIDGGSINDEIPTEEGEVPFDDVVDEGTGTPFNLEEELAKLGIDPKLLLLAGVGIVALFFIFKMK